MSRILIGKSSIFGFRVLPDVVVEATTGAVRTICKSILGEAATELPVEPVCHSELCMVGVISFEGPTKWSLSWVLPRSTAEAIVQEFCGTTIPFDDMDMGDATGELVNVLAGFVTEELDQRGHATQMSLPTMMRGHSIEFVRERTQSHRELAFQTRVGPFRICLTGGSLCQWPHGTP
jgi:CheY-specific phosphatase CheX